ncbi:hypothetical protein [Stenotrophomonas maltophilia]|uniref:hypothetical protein n=1 Tax=Stenotrophomonas maltophilia TaxID=40324 RepID=UPI0012AF3159|nr:hypothetical protein [Stenotrophomonas maltophilia]
MLDFALARVTLAFWNSSRARLDSTGGNGSRAWLDATLFCAPAFGTLRGYFFKD